MSLKIWFTNIFFSPLFFQFLGNLKLDANDWKSKTKISYTLSLKINGEKRNEKCKEPCCVHHLNPRTVIQPCTTDHQKMQRLAKHTQTKNNPTWTIFKAKISCYTQVAIFSSAIPPPPQDAHLFCSLLLFFFFFHVISPGKPNHAGRDNELRANWGQQYRPTVRNPHCHNWDAVGL